MRLNLGTTLSAAGPAGPATSRLLLVPYTRSHVPTYHAWMEDEDNRATTGSERLSMSEELAMQAAWAADEDKLTFIILDGGAFATATASGMPRRQAELKAMVGDVNLYLIPGEEEGSEEGEGDGTTRRPPSVTGEVGVMVASPAARGKGFGSAAVRLMLTYARTHLGLTAAVAKVGRGNAASRSLFTGRLGFRSIKEVAVFDEVHLRADLPPVGGAESHPALVDCLEEGAYGAWLDG